MSRSKEKPSFKHHLGPICTLVFESVVVLLLLTHLCAGQSQVVTPSQPIVATLGNDIMLQCQLEPAKDATSETVEWARSDLDPRFVYVWRDGVELESKKHLSYVGRTSLSINKLKDGDISLKLDKVKVSDEGTYRCFVPTLQRESSVQLVVGATSSLIISLEKTDGDEDVSGAVLQCESKGWYPKPEVLWLDGEGKLLSAGPAEPIRGPDGLYTVSSRVTVEKKHSKSFTCRVQQKNINQTRETTINVSDDLFKFPSSSSALTAGFAVSLSLCILLILLLVFFMWRRKRSKSKKTHQPEEGRERAQLMSAETVKVKKLNENIQKNLNSLLKELERREKELEKNQGNQTITPFLAGEQQAEVQRLRDKIEKKIKVLQTLKDELEQKIKEVIQQLQEEQKRRKESENRHKGEIEEKEKELQTLRQRLEEKKQEIRQQLQEEQRRKNLEDQLETKNEELETKKKELETKNEELETKNEEQMTKNKEHKWEIEDKEKELQSLKEELVKKNKEISQKLQEEQKRRKEAENQLSNQEDQLETKNKELKGEIEKNIKMLQSEKQRLEKKIKEIKVKEDQLKMIDKVLQEKEMELQKLKEELEEKNKEDQIISVELKKIIEEMEKNMMEKDLQTLKHELEKKNKEDSSTPRNHTDAN